MGGDARCHRGRPLLPVCAPVPTAWLCCAHPCPAVGALTSDEVQVIVVRPCRSCCAALWRALLVRPAAAAARLLAHSQRLSTPAPSVLSALLPQTMETQVIQGALDMANKTAQAVMTPLPKVRARVWGGVQAGGRRSPSPCTAPLSSLWLPLTHTCRTTPPPSPFPPQVFMLSGDAVINQELLARVLAAGHSRVPVYEGDNKQVGRGEQREKERETEREWVWVCGAPGRAYWVRPDACFADARPPAACAPPARSPDHCYAPALQALLGLILVKELLVVDETKGTRVRDLCLRDLPFLR